MVPCTRMIHTNREMVSEPDTERYVSLLAVSRRRVDMRRSASRNTGPERGWIVMSYVGRGGEQNTLYKGVKTFP